MPCLPKVQMFFLPEGAGILPAKKQGEHSESLQERIVYDG
jgi:hypothetical protein